MLVPDWKRIDMKFPAENLDLDLTLVGREKCMGAEEVEGFECWKDFAAVYLSGLSASSRD